MTDASILTKQPVIANIRSLCFKCGLSEQLRDLFICEQNMECAIPAHGGPRVWQYISLPRGPVEPDEPPGVHLENRILRGWTLLQCRIRADIEPFEMV